MLQPKTQKRYLELDSLRGFAALIVVFFHFTWGHEGAGFVFRWGNTGVDLFFMISGFVIFMSLNKIRTASEFIINRFCRLYPTYWACVTLSYILINIYYQVVAVDFQKLVFTDYLVNLTMLQFYFNVPNVDQPYWTMIIELIFYVSILILFYFKLFPYINSIGLIVSLIVATIANLPTNEVVENVFKWIPFLSYIPLFFSGIIFYQLAEGTGKMLKKYATLIVCLTCQMALLEITGRKVFLSQPQYLSMLLVFFFLFILFVNGKLKFIVSRFTVFLGEISFALYLTHQFISVNILLPFFVDRLSINYWISSFLITLPIIILIAAAITYLIEKPLRARMKSKLYSVFNIQIGDKR